jgi:predicted CXXCH cytochrome family protein
MQSHIRWTMAVVGLWFLCFAEPVDANVAGTKHDMYFLQKGTDPNVCTYCHIPHNAFGEKIWSDWANEAQLQMGTFGTIGNMCYTCHDGTVSMAGLNTVFNANLQQHKITSGEDCDMCHTVHDNTNGKFMSVGKTQNSYCATCHDNVMNAGGLGDHVGPGNHPSYWTSTPTHNWGLNDCNFCHGPYPGYSGNVNSCEICHVPAHGAMNYSVGQITHPILREDNTDSAFCGHCHPANVQTQPTNPEAFWKHPANMNPPGSWGNVDCKTCHDPHQPDKPTHPAILQEQNVDSGYCMICHDATGNSQGPSIGDSHPVNILLSMTPVDPTTAPTGSQIDDDGIKGIDYLLNSDNMICETCHSVHRKGHDQYMLRQKEMFLCQNCHQTN